MINLSRDGTWGNKDGIGYFLSDKIISGRIDFSFLCMIEWPAGCCDQVIKSEYTSMNSAFPPDK